MRLPHVTPRIKICGFTREQDARIAIELGIDALGFVFYNNSKRAVTPQMLKWLKNLPPLTQLVALFVNPSQALVDSVLEQLPIDILQFHGNEDPAFCQQFTPRYIKAVPMQGLSQQQALDYMQQHPQAAAFLLDNYGAGDIGGSGTAFDWGKIPTHTEKPLIMAGGLHADNVGVIIQQCQPYGVDVSSGVESAPGIKSAEKMAAFVNAVRQQRS